MPLIDASGTPLFYDLAGPADAPVVAFSNSIGTTLEMWDAQVRAFAGQFRVLRYDTRGHGRSPVVPGVVTVDALADDLAALLAALDIRRAAIVGLSLGGMTAQSLAVRHPGLVDSLVLVATAAYLPGAWAERAATVRGHGMQAIAEAVIERWFTPRSGTTRPSPPCGPVSSPTIPRATRCVARPSLPWTCARPTRPSRPAR